MAVPMSINGYPGPGAVRLKFTGGDGRARLLPGTDGFKAVVEVPCLHGEPVLLGEIGAALSQSSLTILIDAAELSVRDIDSLVLAAWLRRNLQGGDGVVLLAISTEAQLTHLQSSNARKQRLRTLDLAGIGARVVGLSAFAAVGLGVAAAWEKGRHAFTARDRSGLAPDSGDAHVPVALLVAILMGPSCATARDRLLRDARKRKRRGSDEAVLRAWVVEQANLARSLAGLFAPFELAVLAREHLQLELAGLADGREMAARILEALGFHAAGTSALGLQAARTHLESIREFVGRQDAPPEFAASLGPQLERVARCMLTCHLRLAFDTTRPLDKLLPRIQPYASRDVFGGTPATKLSLGQLAHGLEAFEAWRQVGEERNAVAKFRSVYGDRGPSPRLLRELVPVRNALAHEQPEPISRRDVMQYLDASSAWLDSLRDDSVGPRLFPALVTVNAIGTDPEAGIGVFRARSVDDEGRKEVLSLSRRIPVNSSWYLYPRTAPVRVDPLLVDAR